MKQFNTCKSLLLAGLVCGAGVVQAQVANTAHPLAFETVAGTTTLYNYYKNYVGERVQVSAPSSIAGDFAFTTANDGSGGTSMWGGYIDTMVTPMVDVPIFMPGGTGAGDDSLGCSGFTGATASSMVGKIAVIWRGSCEFGQKAAYAEAAGARAIVIINQYPGEGPVGMAAGAVGATVTIPVIMIGNLDGIKISGQYRSLPPGSVKMTIIPWGKGLATDLGFVPAGVSIWHDCAIPANQLTGTLPSAYKAIDGAFIANYGTTTANNVQLATNLTFTPTGGSASSIHTSTLTVTPSASSTAFPTTDSIYAVMGAEYDLTGAGGQGRYDINYTITSSATDMFTFDNTYTHSFYATDSVFSKSRYDFVHKHPVATAWYGPAAPYMWGVPYFVAKGGDAVRDIQFSPSTGPGDINPAVSAMNFYIFKWVDGSGGVTPADEAIEGGELELVGTGIYGFQVGDSSFEFFNANVTNDTNLLDGASTGSSLLLEDNTWYFVTAEVAGSTSVALGNDGIISAYPRSYGRKHFHNNTELYNPIIGADEPTMRANPTAPFLSYTFGGGSFDVDSVVYNSQNGLVPSLAMRVRPVTSGVAQVANNNKVNLFPNPANDQINVSFDLTAPVKEMTFTIINAAGQVVTKETKHNVQKDQVSFSTSTMASGNYFMVITADGKQMHRKFTVIK